MVACASVSSLRAQDSRRLRKPAGSESVQRTNNRVAPAANWCTKATKPPEKKKTRWRSSSNRLGRADMRHTGLNLQQSYWLSVMLNFG